MSSIVGTTTSGASSERLKPARPIVGCGLILSSDNDAVLSAFINTAHEMPEHKALILNDDLLIEEPSIGRALAMRLDPLAAKAPFHSADQGEITGTDRPLPRS